MIKKFKTELKDLKGSFDVDKRFWKTLGSDLATVLILILLGFGFSQYIDHKATELSDIQPFDVNNPYYSVSRIQDAAKLQKFQSEFFTYLWILAGVAAVTLLLSRTCTYVFATRSAMTKKLFKKLPLFIVIWTVVSVAVVYVLQAILYQLFSSSFAYSVTTQLLVLLSVSILLPLTTFFVITPSLLFARSLSWKQTFKDIDRILVKNFMKFIPPMLVTLLILVGINLLMRLITYLFGAQAFTVAFTAALLLYISWMRLYYLKRIESIDESTKMRKTPTEKRSKKTNVSKKKARRTAHKQK